MKTVTVRQAKTHLSRLIQEALSGKEIVIAKRDQPLVKLEVVSEASQNRRIGGSPGLVKSMAEDFSGPLKDFEDCMQ